MIRVFSIIILSLIGFFLKFQLNYDLGSVFGVIIFFYWFIKLIKNLNEHLPLIELLIFMYALQYLFGPALTYNGFEEYTNYKMLIAPDTYFKYTISVFFSMIIGIRLFFDPKTFKINMPKINVWLSYNLLIPYYLIFIGILAPLTKDFFPSSLSFIEYLLESFKMIGLFMLIVSKQKIKPILIILIYGLIFLSAFYGGMFHDLLTWLVALGMILSYRYKPKLEIKIIGIIVFVLFAIFIQSIKGGLREQIWYGGAETNTQILTDVVIENKEETGGLLSLSNIGPQITRINQGWILGNVIENVPNNVPHSYGSNIKKYLFSAVMPRILAPDKMNAGEKELFILYTGHFIDVGTSMGLGLFADAYIEFGSYGALVYVFLFGAFYGFVLNKFLKYSIEYPVLILFSILAFIYPMRPDCETQTVLGHLLKTIMLLTIIFYFNKRSFSLSRFNK